MEVGEKELCRQIDAYGQEGVILGDLHSELRNRLLKYCYAKEIRVYLTPKLSDIMVRKAEALHIFDTPLLLARNSVFRLIRDSASACWICSYRRFFL